MSVSARSADAIVIGGGVAGLALAAWLAPRARVLLLERAPALASHASGNSAAIFRSLEEDAASARLPRRSRQLLVEGLAAELLEPTGLLLVDEQAEPIARLAREAERASVPHACLRDEALRELAPSLAGGRARHGILLRDSGVLDAPALMRALARRARAHHAELRTGQGVARIERAGDRALGVVLDDGQRIAAGHVILAGGAWSAELGGLSGAGLPLSPLRRHLLELQLPAEERPREPPVWRVSDEVYYRRQTDHVLASPCDEARSGPASLALDPSMPSALASKLRDLAPEFAGATVRRAWPCLRTFAPDRELVVGPDPRIRGLHWFAGLGGRGMSVAPAAAELLSANLLEGAALPAELAPSRLL